MRRQLHTVLHMAELIGKCLPLEGPLTSKYCLLLSTSG